MTITSGQQSTLSWTTTGAATVTISGVGTVQPERQHDGVADADHHLHPDRDQLRRQERNRSGDRHRGGGAGSASRDVRGQPADHRRRTVHQALLAGDNATNITITPGVGSNLNANDCATVSPTQTTTYTLTATNASGQIQANATVNVGAVRITSFTSDPLTSLAAGAPVTLSWTTQNASSVVSVGNDLGPQTLNPNGSLVVKPITNTTYTLTAYGPGGQTVSVTISVFVR